MNEGWNKDWVHVCDECNLRFPCTSALLLHQRWEHGEDAERENKVASVKGDSAESKD